MNKLSKNLMMVSLGALLGGTAQGAVLSTDDFLAGNEGWADRDAGVDMTVGWTGVGPGFGNPAGSMQGTFGAQGVPASEVDAFRLSGVGDLWGANPGYSLDSFTFDFYSDDILPGDLIFRINGSGGTFIRNIASYATSLDSWQGVTVSLGYSGWLGGTEASFSNTLGSVNWIDIQVARNGTGAQTYYFDNFILNGTLGGGGGGGGSSAVPEPNTLLLLSMAGAGLISVRRHVLKTGRMS
jgi:hypothetical protein